MKLNFYVKITGRANTNFIFKGPRDADGCRGAGRICRKMGYNFLKIFMINKFLYKSLVYI